TWKEALSRRVFLVSFAECQSRTRRQTDRGSLMRHLIVCCDGTWNTADQRHDGVPVPTNVVRLYNALADETEKGIEQLKYYHPGVGTEPGLFDRAMGGATGAGLDRNIMSAYHWLCRNYRNANDRIFLFGFSRG